MNIKLNSAAAVFMLLSSVSWADNNVDLYKTGGEAHQNHCLKCHTDAIYTRDNRFVKSMAALGSQVRRCKDSNDIPWFDEDTDAVIHFLNEKYYKF